MSWRTKGCGAPALVPRAPGCQCRGPYTLNALLTRPTRMPTVSWLTGRPPGAWALPLTSTSQ